LRTRLLHRRCVLPGNIILISKSDAQALGLELAIFLIRDRVASHPENPEWQRTLHVNLVKVGDQRCNQGDRDGALAAYEESLAMRRKAVAAAPADIGAQDDVRTALTKIGGVHLGTGDRASRAQPMRRAWASCASS